MLFANKKKILEYKYFNIHQLEGRFDEVFDNLIKERNDGWEFFEVRYSWGGIPTLYLSKHRLETDEEYVKRIDRDNEELHRRTEEVAERKELYEKLKKEFEH